MTQPPPPGDWNAQQPPPSGGWETQQQGGWNVPPPPAGRPRERIRAARIAAGIATALGGHLLTIAVMVVAAVADNSEIPVGAGLIGMLIGQVIVFLACLTVGVVLITRAEPGFGIGLLIGWAVGLLIAPIAGFGVCLYMFSGTGQ